jgi:ribosomal protein S18 acetylase RimI-like enzyme
MNHHFDLLFEQIFNLYSNSFPSYLKKSKTHLKKYIKNYKFFDYWFELINKIDKLHINNYSLLKPNQNVLIGFSFLHYFPKIKMLHLDYICIDKKHQGRGNGSYYLNYIINTFYKYNKNINYLVLECEDHLIKFYEKNNFVRIKSNYHNNGIKLNLMIYNDYEKIHEIFKLSRFLQEYFLEKKFVEQCIFLFYYQYILSLQINNIFYIINKKFKSLYKHHLFDNFYENKLISIS